MFSSDDETKQDRRFLFAINLIILKNQSMGTHVMGYTFLLCKLKKLNQMYSDNLAYLEKIHLLELFSMKEKLSWFN